ncbi:MAG: hypothetical protein HRT47_12200 [Candidatus Caenarcaniphilales bacterium]|nr:hypothetical protein [Candidatus Caenarcaniphilales bacterium]
MHLIKVVCICLVLVGIFISKVNATIKQNRIIKNDNKLSSKFNKKVSNKTSRRLIGRWTLFDSENEVLFKINIKGTSGFRHSIDKRIDYLFSYDILDLQDSVIDSNLTGYIQKDRMFFTATYLNGYSLISVRFKKVPISGKVFFTEFFITDRECFFENTFDSIDFYTCGFIQSIHESSTSGTMWKF